MRQEQIWLSTVISAVTIIALLSGCDSGGNSLPSVAIPPTPTANAQTQNSGPAFDLLRQAQQAMRGVTSYHFRLDNSVDTNTVESNRIEISLGTPPPKPTRYEGDVEPPIARYWPSTDLIL